MKKRQRHNRREKIKKREEEEQIDKFMMEMKRDRELREQIKRDVERAKAWEREAVDGVIQPVGYQ